MRQIPGDDQIRASGVRNRRTTLAVTAALATCTALTGIAHAASFTQYPARTSLVSSADGSHAFNSATFSRVPQLLSASNYVEKEYFLSGLANTYQYTNPSSTTDDTIALEQNGPVAYTNRILVRAPSNPAAFSGNVIVELANDALISDNETAWPYANSQFIANGDVYILVTSTPAGLATMKAYAPTRYRALTWPTTAATKSCGNGSIGENGIVYDQVTALGNLLKSNSATGPLAGYNVKHLFLTGYSAAAELLLTYNRVFGLNSPLYDGYFEVAGGYRAALNACEASGTTTGRVQPVASTVSAVFQAQTESELKLAPIEGATLPNAADSNTATNRYRYYEIAGTGHVNGDLLAHSPERNDFPTIPGVQYLADVTQSQLNAECSNEPTNSVITAFPNRYVYDAMWANLESWVANGVAYTPPSEASRITNTNAFTYLGYTAPTGGVRSPAVDYPIDRYAAGSTPPSGASTALSTFCLLTGDQVTAGSPNYTNTVADASTLAATGFLTAADLAAITANPSLAYTYPNGTTTIPDNPPAAQ